jgi:hypothetical protein
MLDGGHVIDVFSLWVDHLWPPPNHLVTLLPSSRNLLEKRTDG